MSRTQRVFTEKLHNDHHSFMCPSDCECHDEREEIRYQFGNGRLRELDRDEDFD